MVDEIQRAPELLNEIHRLIESRKLRFALTGSSARKLRRKGVNLLAGRALTRYMHPLTALELGKDFDLKRALSYGCLPLACTSDEPQDFLKSYVATYLREEVQQEGLARNIGAFSRFLEAASFSQGSVLNMTAVARECAVSVKVVEDYFSILEDLLIAVRLPVFSRRAKRRMVAHPKFYYFDAGVFQTIRPRGPLDAPEQIHGPALETLFLQQVRAVNDYKDLGYRLHYWRTSSGDEVDFVLYGDRGLRAFEVKMASSVRPDDLRSLLRAARALRGGVRVDPDAAVAGLVTIASPHLGTPWAELGNFLGSTPAAWMAPFMGFGTLNRSQALYHDLSREHPRNLLGWLNRTPHPIATYVSVVRVVDGRRPELGDSLAYGAAQDLNAVPALAGRAETVFSPGDHGLRPDDGLLLVSILGRMTPQ